MWSVQHLDPRFWPDIWYLKWSYWSIWFIIDRMNQSFRISEYIIVVVVSRNSRDSFFFFLNIQLFTVERTISSLWTKSKGLNWMNWTEQDICYSFIIQWELGFRCFSTDSLYNCQNQPYIHTPPSHYTIIKILTFYIYPPQQTLQTLYLP